MPPETDERAVLLDMLEFAREVVTFIQGRTRQDLDADRTLLRALERTLELVGECARKVPENVRSTHPDVPSKDIFKAIFMDNVNNHRNYNNGIRILSG